LLRGGKYDPLLYPCVALLGGWSLALIERLLPLFTPRQTLWWLMGNAILLFLARWPQALFFLQRWRGLLLASGLGLLALTIVAGVNPTGFGPRLWLGLGKLFFQPSEPFKLVFVVYLAGYMAAHQHRSLWQFYPPLFAVCGLCVVLLVWQRDLGTAAIFFLVFLGLLYLASGRWLIVAGGVGLSALAIIAAYSTFDLVAFRVDIWRDPWRDPSGDSFQIVQSLMAIAQGGFFGEGIGQGIPTFIPVVHTDFVYSAIAEEWGFLGAASVLSLLAFLTLRGLRLGFRLEKQSFAAYLAVGLSLLLGVQTLVITGGALNLVPLTGVTLPFVSYGGSSLLMHCAAVGIWLALSRTGAGDAP
jgi:cell division protein FtsW (lipid II flippase)